VCLRNQGEGDKNVPSVGMEGDPMIPSIHQGEVAATHGNFLFELWQKSEGYGFRAGPATDCWIDRVVKADRFACEGLLYSHRQFLGDEGAAIGVCARFDPNRVRGGDVKDRRSDQLFWLAVSEIRR